MKATALTAYLTALATSHLRRPNSKGRRDRRPHFKDEREAISYEWTPSDLKKGPLDKEGLLISINHFMNPKWGFEAPIPGISDPITTEQRRRNLVSLAKMHSGNLTPDVVMDITSRPLSEGGPLQVKELPTSYQVVAVPEDLKIWVRIPGVQNWTEVDLSLFFRGKGSAGM